MFHLLLNKIKLFFHYFRNAFSVIIISPRYSVYKKKVPYKILLIFLVFFSFTIPITLSFFIDRKNIQTSLVAEEKTHEAHAARLLKIENFYQDIKDYRTDHDEEVQLILSKIGAKDASFFSLNNNWFAEEQLDLFLNQNNELNDEILPLYQELEKSFKNVNNDITSFELLEKFNVVKSGFIKKIPMGWPLKNNSGYRTSGFGIRQSPFDPEEIEFHYGVDIAAYPNTEIIATANGVVTFSGTKNGYGNIVMINHAFNFKSVYAHNSKNLVKTNQKVKKGETIALVGNTGRSTGFHIHYEVKIGSKYQDPWPYIIARF